MVTLSVVNKSVSITDENWIGIHDLAKETGRSVDEFLNDAVTTYLLAASIASSVWSDFLKNMEGKNEV